MLTPGLYCNTTLYQTRWQSECSSVVRRWVQTDDWPLYGLSSCFSCLLSPPELTMSLESESCRQTSLCWFQKALFGTGPAVFTKRLLNLVHCPLVRLQFWCPLVGHSLQAFPAGFPPAWAREPLLLSGLQLLCSQCNQHQHPVGTACS